MLKIKKINKSTYRCTFIYFVHGLQLICTRIAVYKLIVGNYETKINIATTPSRNI